MEKIYLGDGVYCEVEDGMFKLTTENGIETTNIIWLDPIVATTFVQYAKKAGLQV